MTTIFRSLDELRARVGDHLGCGEWIEIDQARIEAFADVTDDHQWIHVDPERAKDSVFGATVAHGYLTASLLPALVRTAYRVEGARMGVNYGSDTIRYPAAVTAGSQVRAGVELLGVEDGPRGSQVVTRITVESDRAGKPVCVATTRSLLVF